MTNLHEDNLHAPLTSIEQDRLEREELTATIAKKINKAFNKKSAAVYGLYGPWGAGKTSLVNFVKEKIEKENKEIEKNERISIIDFNPWLYNSGQKIALDLFTEIYDKINSDSVKPKIKKLWKKIKPDVFSLGINYILCIGGKWNLNKLPELKKKLSDLKDIMRVEKQKILVIIDDLDRNTPEEIKEVFRVLKGIADLPYFVYLIPCDRYQVAKALGLQFGFSDGFDPKNEQKTDSALDNGLLYMEKFIQSSTVIPYTGRQRHKIILEKKCKELWENECINCKNKNLLFETDYEACLDAVADFCKTPRQAIEFFDDLDTHYTEKVAKNVYIPDFIIVRAIKFFIPEEYGILEECFFSTSSILKDLNIIKQKIVNNIIFNEKHKITTPIGRLEKEKHGIKEENKKVAIIPDIDIFLSYIFTNYLDALRIADLYELKNNNKNAYNFYFFFLRSSFAKFTVSHWLDNENKETYLEKYKEYLHEAPDERALGNLDDKTLSSWQQYIPYYFNREPFKNDQKQA